MIIDTGYLILALIISVFVVATVLAVVYYRKRESLEIKLNKSFFKDDVETIRNKILKEI
jgi:hypothetical protein